MPPLPIDLNALIVTVLAAILAGFVTGFAGFGTGLVASGLWFYALPPIMVPPLVALASVAGQLVGLVTVRKAFAWSQAAPYMIGGVLGLPLGILALGAASPDVLRTCVGVFLVGYAGFQLLRRANLGIGNWGGRWLDGIVGIGGGFLGGFAGLSGPLPLIWLQLRGGDSTAHRAIYQPFNLVVLALASLGDGGARHHRRAAPMDRPLVPAGDRVRCLARHARLYRRVDGHLSACRAGAARGLGYHLAGAGAAAPMIRD